MEQFIVSARKYRPGTFESVVGQEHVTNTLKNAIRNNHLAQAFLFCGPRGVGKTTCARILAKTINCLNLKDSIEPCNECESCTSFNKNASFNIYELDAASNNSVDDIRGLVEQVRYAPQGAKYKIYIIDEVHMLSQAAFNAFLKTLEEPPSYAIFILATTERHKILPTILSRCQVFDFNRITVASIVGHLKNIAGKEAITAEEDALHVIGEKADGALRDALSIFDQMVSFSGNQLTYADVIRNLNILDHDYYFRVCDMLAGGATAEALMLLDEVVKKGFDPQLFLGGLCDHLRNLLVSKNPKTVALLEVTETAIARYAEQSARLTLNFLFNALQLAGQADASYKSARNQRLHVELLLLKLAQLDKVMQLASTPAPKAEAPKNFSVSLPKAEPVRQPVTAAPPKKVNIPKQAIPSINLNFVPGKGPAQEEEKPQETIREISGVTSEIQRFPLNEERIKQLWQEYASKASEAGKHALASGMRGAQISLQGQTLTAAVVGKHVQEMLNDEKVDMMAHLHRQLEEGIQLQFRMELSKAEMGKDIIYTYDDKLKALIQTNPDLEDFMKSLNLEVDY